MDLTQIKNDIRSGKSTHIYYSPDSLWWTHLHADVAEATDKGTKYRVARLNQMLQIPTMPDAEKDRLRQLIKITQSPVGRTQPTDPLGCPLVQLANPLAWIEAAELRPQMFGRHGIQAFLKAHHQNCGGFLFKTWADYNQLIDKH